MISLNKNIHHKAISVQKWKGYLYRHSIWMLSWVYICICLFLGLETKAQVTGHPFYKFTHYTSQDGLPQNSVLAIMQDQKGFLWFGTDDGLAKYDGYQFTTFKHSPNNNLSLGNNVIRDMVQDKNGFIWISTEGGGINIFDPKTLQFQSLNQQAQLADMFGSTKTNNLIIDQKGDIWLSTLSDGIYHIVLPKKDLEPTLTNYFKNLNINNFNTFNSSINDNKIWQIFEDSKGKIWIGTYDAGMQILDSNTNDFFENEIIHDGEKIKSIKSFFEDSNGTIWLGTEKNGVFKKSNEEEKFHAFIPSDPSLVNPLEKENITSFLEDKQGHLWIGTLGGGLYVLDQQTGNIFHYKDNPSDPYSLNGQSVYKLFEDKDDNIWIGMYSGEGLNKINPNAQHFEHYRQQASKSASLSGKMVKSILKDKRDNLWVGMFNGGLNFKETNQNEFEQIKLPLKNTDNSVQINVQVIYEDQNGKLWIGTDGSGMYSYLPESGKFNSYLHQENDNTSLSKNEVWAIAEDHEGQLWIGTANGGGLNRLDPKTGKFKRFLYQANNNKTPSFNDIRSLLIDSKNRLWVGTYGGGLNLYNFSNGQFTYYQHDPNKPNSISHNIITSLYEDNNGYLWIGTFGGGLNRMDVNTGQFVHFREKDGLPSDVIKAVLEDNTGQLWISTVKGLTLYNPEKGTFKNFTADDGLQSDEFNLGAAFKDKKTGKLYFGGTNGFNAFLPDQVKQTPVPKIPELTQLRVLNHLVNPGDTIEDKVLLKKDISFSDELVFNHDHNSFELAFSALEFNGQDKIQYAYKLNGFDKDWIYTDADRRYAPYANLKAGEYTFHLKSTTENGQQSSGERLLYLRVLPPWYQSTVAYLAYILLILLAAYVTKSIITFRIKMKNDLRFERLEHQKQEEINQLKLRFFTNISHELRTPLMLIKVPLEQLISRADLSQQVHYQLNSIHNNATRLLRLINQLLEFRKQETGHVKLEVQEIIPKNFIQNIFTSFEAMAKHRNIDFKLNFGPNLPESVWFDLDQMEKVCYNLCYNAFKFTPDGGKITLSLNSGTIKNKIGELPALAIQVEDNGKGILAEHQDKIFERFFQVDDSEGNLTAGTGIGLALSKNIVEFHHGSIEMESRPNIKTTFTVLLPCGKQHFAPHDFKEFPTQQESKNLPIEQELNNIDKHLLSSLENPSPTVKPDPSLLNKKLLLVEDNEELLSLMKGVLAQHFQVITAKNGEQGLEMSKLYNPDFIISDVMMPKMDGVAMCSLLKQDLTTSHIPIILLTARSAYDYQREGYASGADDYLSKPFPLDLLISKVRNLLLTRERLIASFKQKPDLEPSGIAVSSKDNEWMKTAIEVVEKHIDDADFDISAFVKEMGLSRTLLFEKIKAITGHTPNDFITIIRLKRAAQLLLQGDLKVAEISYMVGFNNPKYFSKCFQKQFGCSPSKYKSQVPY
ncbi:hybrid sensor histidine kinase/response regulator transcription factor [Echinicola shivajiensis]|uniref:hybrid sensor histidine kinase/response regulator transcription factor n=1 Tax=Echinicola shivajiensis TaxID=1035916 RepID=UPI001FE6D77F|nr:hybrid sensor histidine kinase/response regulator transcription factor [Echinicola shivajiensis]